MSYSRILKYVECPVPGCPSKSHIAGRMREHFMYRHFHVKFTVMQEGSEPLPWYNMCGMHITAGQLIKHQKMESCFNNTYMRLRRNDVKVKIQCAEMEFNLIGKEVDGCKSCKELHTGTTTTPYPLLQIVGSTCISGHLTSRPPVHGTQLYSTRCQL